MLTITKHKEIRNGSVLFCANSQTDLNPNIRTPLPSSERLDSYYRKPTISLILTKLAVDARDCEGDDHSVAPLKIAQILPRFLNN
jgi:hypothetical protein